MNGALAKGGSSVPVAGWERAYALTLFGGDDLSGVGGGL